LKFSSINLKTLKKSPTI